MGIVEGEREGAWRHRLDSLARIRSKTAPELRRRLRLLLDASLVFVGLAIVAACYRAVFVGVDSSLVALVLLSLYFQLPIVLLRKTHSVPIPTAALTFGACIGISVLAVPNGGFFAAGLVWMAALPVFSTYIAGAVQGVVTAALGGLVLILFFSLQRYGVEFPEPPSGDYMMVSRLFSLVGLVFFVGYYSLRFETERKNALAAAIQSQLDFQSLIEASPEGIAVLSNGSVVYANPTLACVLGVADIQIHGQAAFFAYAQPLFDEMLAEVSSDGTEPGDKKHNVHEFVTNEGTTVQLESNRVRNIQFNGASAVLVTIRDVTTRSRHEAQLRVADRLASVGSLAAGMAHEINTPIAVIQSNVEYVSELVDEENEIAERAEMLAALRDARESAIKIAGIVRDMQSLARIKSIEPSAIDLGHALKAAVKLTAHQTQRRATVEADISDNILVFADSLSLSQVFVNLLINAAEALPSDRDGNNIHVSCRNDGQEAIVEIRDNGPGISAANLMRVFDPFYTTKEIGQGTGLGLSTCRGLIESIGGELVLESTEGSGLLARVHLRLCPPS
ncbi:MAG: PAS domain-containing sensor histidine kinase [Kofleriaceae bacterium]|nr:PAS domain-containing sensor histidine kinase [Kofleriaceae bacterium]